jgi:dehydrogenase/reductase SDR family protein 12
MNGIRKSIWLAYGLKEFGHRGYDKMIKNADPNELNVNLQGKSFMVTGANQGLGYITAKQLAERGGN